MKKYFKKLAKFNQNDDDDDKELKKDEKHKKSYL